MAGPQTGGPDRSVVPELTRLFEAGLVISALTALSKLLGIAREGVLAWAFGTSGAIDAFRVAQSGVFLLIHLFAGSVLDSAFLPTFKHLRTGGHPRLAWRVVRVCGRALLLVGVVLGLLVALWPGTAAHLLAPGFDEERHRTTALLLRAMALAIPLGLLSNLLITVATGLYRFWIPALRALVQNVAILLGILGALGLGSLVYLGYSLSLAHLAMLVLAWLTLRPLWPFRLWPARLPGHFLRRGSERDRLAWRYLSVALIPGLGLVFLDQANVVVERIVASHLAEGSVASLDYARFLAETPLVTLGVGIAQVLLPTMADLSAEGAQEQIRRSLRTALLGSLWCILPIAIWFFVAGEDLVRIVYARGAFDERSVATTSLALRGFTIGLWAWFGGTAILQKLFFAERRVHALLPLTAVVLASFAGLAMLLAPRYGVFGVALALSLSQILYFAWALGLQGRAFVASTLPLLSYLVAGAALLAVGGTWLLDRGFAHATDSALTPFVRAPILLVIIAIGWGLWTLPSPALRSLAIRMLRSTLRRRGAR